MQAPVKRARTEWDVRASAFAMNTFNPIRSIVDGMKLTPNPDKPMIALSIGDPTVFGNLLLPKAAEDAVIEAVKNRKANGYGPSSGMKEKEEPKKGRPSAADSPGSKTISMMSIGYEQSRQAVAEYSSTPTSEVEAKDVVLCSGCSGALDMCITVLANPGQNILVPRPGFSIYNTLAESLGVKVKFYNLLPDKSWEVDLNHLTSLIDDNTATIVVNNPSNPCGSVYSKEHLKAILDIAHVNKVPIIADEIYEHFVFEGNTYHSMASLSTRVPILSCSGLTKRFLVPGWRLGWIVINDKNNVLSEVRRGLVSMSQRILGPNTLIQAALPDILKNTPQDFFHSTTQYIQKNANRFYQRLSHIPGLKPVMPQGAMYMMVGISMADFPEFESDIQFTQSMITEQSVFCLPATCFQYQGYFRVVLTVPAEKVDEACERMELFCRQHYRGASANGNK